MSPHHSDHMSQGSQVSGMGVLYGSVYRAKKGQKQANNQTSDQGFYLQAIKMVEGDIVLFKRDILAVSCVG